MSNFLWRKETRHGYHARITAAPCSRPGVVADYLVTARLKRAVTAAFVALPDEAAFWADPAFRHLGAANRSLDYLLFRLDHAPEPHLLLSWWEGMELGAFTRQVLLSRSL